MGLGKKRKAEAEGTGFLLRQKTTPKKRPRSSRKTRPSPLSSSSSESSSSSSSDSDSSASESDSTSASDSSDSEDSDSDSSSSSSSSSSDISFSAPRAKPAPQSKRKSTTQQQGHIPPGLGSIKTRKRNIRRRLKKKYDAATAGGHEPTPSATRKIPSPPKPKRISAANVAPVGSRPNGSSENQNQNTRTPDGLNMTMFSLGNKNKKKGYKYALAPPTAQKKIFNAPDPDTLRDALQQQGEEDIPAEHLNGPLPPSTTIFTSTSTAEEKERHQNQTRLIPPSELESLGKLPKNMFVTSVDVEEGMWDKSSSSSSKRKQMKKQKQRDWQQDEHDYGYAGQAELYDNDDTAGVIDLDYGSAQGLSSYNTAAASAVAVEQLDTKSALIWSVVENNFDSYPLFTGANTSPTLLENGKLVAWKALALNPETYSPEVLLHIASVLSSSSDGDVSIRRIVRPGWEELDVEDVEGSFGVESIVGMGWRVVDEIKRSS
ncbi:hypothetical protein GYMLUDRAFT_56424 [Collybiopsis luxurians FD-317 M1]|nr:hypothetical protein GYMLUDRAFT_56424 [Collybiopsis luxurians FD-317 M1]